MDSVDRVVVVGASMAGLRAAEAIRKGGWRGELVVIGDEPAMPYNRPPLSKDALKQPPDLESLVFRVPRAAADVSWRIGEAVVRADLDAHTVQVGDETLSWTGLVVATGLRPRRLSVPGPHAGRYVVRTHADAVALRAALGPEVRVVIIGAGFIGCEVAATARTLDAEVDVVAPESVPIERPLGPLLGAELQRRHEAQGVRFHLGVVPVEFGGSGTVDSVTLSDGRTLSADVVVEAVGCQPNVEWLDGNGLDLRDGVLCDEHLRVEGRPDVVACGDVARFANPLFDDVPRRVEHWTMATDTARHAGLTLAAELCASELGDRPPFAPMPSFWSDQYGMRLQSFGSLAAGDDVTVLEGQFDRDVVVGYHRAGRLVGVVLLGFAGRAGHYRNLIASPATASV